MQYNTPSAREPEINEKKNPQRKNLEKQQDSVFVKSLLGLVQEKDECTHNAFLHSQI